MKLRVRAPNAEHEGCDTRDEKRPSEVMIGWVKQQLTIVGREELIR